MESNAEEELRRARERQIMDEGRWVVSLISGPPQASTSKENLVNIYSLYRTDLKGVSSEIYLAESIIS
jgi:hypothetical protein